MQLADPPPRAGQHLDGEPPARTDGRDQPRQIGPCQHVHGLAVAVPSAAALFVATLLEALALVGTLMRHGLIAQDVAARDIPIRRPVRRPIARLTRSQRVRAPRRRIRRRTRHDGGCDPRQPPSLRQPDVPDYPYKLNGPEGLLAHYTTAETAFEYVLPDHQLRLSPYRLMRDPAENKDIVPGTGTTARRRRTSTSRYRAMLDGIKACATTAASSASPATSRRRRTFGCCWARPRMWEQYADRHRGVCLLFDGERLRNRLATALSEQGILSWLGEIDYTAAGIAGSTALRYFDDPDLRGQRTRSTAIADHIDEATATSSSSRATTSRPSTSTAP